MREEVLHTMFLELHKAYDALDRLRCLDILERYGLGTRALHLLHRYWESIHMVAGAGGYYRETLCVERCRHRGTRFQPLYSMW